MPILPVLTSTVPHACLRVLRSTASPGLNAAFAATLRRPSPPVFRLGACREGLKQSLHQVDCHGGTL